MLQALPSREFTLSLHTAPRAMVCLWLAFEQDWKHVGGHEPDPGLRPPAPALTAPEAAHPAQPTPSSTSSPSTSADPTAANPALLTPPLPAHNDAPVFVAPAGDLSAHASEVRGDPAADVPGVTITPPTPPASETLGRAAGEAIKSAVEATAAGAGAVGEAPTVVAAA
ncbi:hypothetical protein NUW54_g10743 [Trametes sanguinea]|uniref:Uncharacterized protein n=1 Tax=Trametes sanguinea TaxID=158606 RepID=A0ACC1NUB5_9APHY|nr:hypothetical protein NUW54_g10743 [Trametes sanguinea]